MPNVIDNITLRLVDSLREMLAVSYGADCCIGYFHLRGWRKIDDLIENFNGVPGEQARILVGMFRAPDDEEQEFLNILDQPETGVKVMKQRETRLVESFKEQLTFGMPDNSSESGLRRLVKQLKAKKVVVKVFLPYPLHAKLYLTYNDHPAAPIKAFVGSSNLTGPGLSEQGELNVDVTDVDTTKKLKDWFEDRWNNQYARDISELLVQIIEESWVREEPVSPYLVYLKIAYHLAFEALEAPREYKIPPLFKDIVLPFQTDAILRLRHMLRNDMTNPNANRVALVGDVVGMGKTLTATAVAKMYQIDEGGRVIICCPPKLKKMWDDYIRLYEITGEVIPYSQTKRLATLQGRTRLIILDESHNLRNRENLAWTELHDYIVDQDAKVLLLSATPYNKHYIDLSNQLRLVLDEKADLGIRPEALFRSMTEDQFFARYQVSPRSLVAFEHSYSPDDWRDLLKIFMVRRTRGYIIKNYTEHDDTLNRDYITIPSTGLRSYFPKRTPLTVKFPITPGDPYSKLFNSHVVDTIGQLKLPRYGLGGYVDGKQLSATSKDDREQLENLSQAGQRLIGYCRTNLFKRLESSGYCFLLSLERHALRNLVYTYAIENGYDLPIGAQDVSMLDTAISDIDVDSEKQTAQFDVTVEQEEITEDIVDPVAMSITELQKKAKEIYDYYTSIRSRGSKKFRWISSHYFTKDLSKDLMTDAKELIKIVCNAGDWDADVDKKLDKLYQVLTKDEANSKVLVFTQFADTARYLAKQLKLKMKDEVEAVTADTSNTTDLVRRFSPNSNQYTMAKGEHSIRVLIATEVLSEGQNCQDANVVVNFDLPWAIIRLIQRAGRVDRIGQENAEVRVYSCLPAEGVENLIKLRKRLLHRLKENLEVIGTDEHFFEDEKEHERMGDIYAEKSGSLDDDGADAEDVDIPSMAQAIWNQALKEDSTVENAVKKLPDQVFATRDEKEDQGVLVYFKTSDGYDSLVRVGKDGNIITQSLYGILRAAACLPDTPALQHHPKHHELVQKGVEEVIKEYLEVGGNLGPKNSARRRIYERLSAYREDVKATVQGSLFQPTDLKKLEAIIEAIYKHPLTERARELINRRFREGANDIALTELTLHLLDDGILVAPLEKHQNRTPKLICSIGLFPKEEVIDNKEAQ